MRPVAEAGFDLRIKILRVEQGALALAKSRYDCAKVFSFGATEIDPKHLSVWIVTDTDAQRDALAHDAGLRESLVGVLHAVDYPQAAVPEVGFAFESEETVKRDFGGNWWYAIK